MSEEHNTRDALNYMLEALKTPVKVSVLYASGGAIYEAFKLTGSPKLPRKIKKKLVGTRSRRKKERPLLFSWITHSQKAAAQ